MDFEAFVDEDLDKPPGLTLREERSGDIVEDLVTAIAPTEEEQQKREDIIQYIGCLLREVFCQIGDDVDLLDVVSYGSVPLKTYMAEGDIDITALVIWPGEWPFPSDAWIPKLKKILEDEEHQPTELYQVRQIDVIYAEVSIVKCKVDGFVVDMSVNSIGGVAKLAFLEKVDRVIGCNLLKKSVALMKSWCYYESRILASNRWLLSSYAVETIVLHALYKIIRDEDNDKYRSRRKVSPDERTNSPHAFINPLDVFEEALKICLSFDWSRNALTIPGPVPLEEIVKDSDKAISLFDQLEERGGSSMSKEMPDYDEYAEGYDSEDEDVQSDLYLPDDTSTGSRRPSKFDIKFLRKCKIKYGYSTILDRPFQKRAMNIVDPLVHFNNISIGVNVASMFRIQGAMELCFRKIQEAKEEAGADYSRFCRLCIDRVFKEVHAAAKNRGSRKNSSQQTAHVSLAGNKEKIKDSFHVSKRVWNTVCKKQDVLPPIDDCVNQQWSQREMRDSSYGYQSDIEAITTPGKNPSANFYPEPVADNDYQAEIDNSFNSEPYEETWNENAAQSEDAYVAHRGLPSHQHSDSERMMTRAVDNERMLNRTVESKRKLNRTVDSKRMLSRAVGDDLEDRESGHGSYRLSKDLLRRSNYHANGMARQFGHDQYSIPHSPEKSANIAQVQYDAINNTLANTGKLRSGAVMAQGASPMSNPYDRQPVSQAQINGTSPMRMNHIDVRYHDTEAPPGLNYQRRQQNFGQAHPPPWRTPDREAYRPLRDRRAYYYQNNTRKVGYRKNPGGYNFRRGPELGTNNQKELSSSQNDS